jgi:SAM-dependent methyltransferase
MSVQWPLRLPGLLSVIATLWRRLRRRVGRQPSRPVRRAADAAAPVDAPLPPPPDLPPCPVDRIEVIDACPVCGGAERSRVCRYNKLILSVHPPDEASYKYDYCLCHDCGVVSARRRPAGNRYAWLIEHFEETLGRVEVGQRLAGKAVLSSYRLTDDDRADLRARAARGVFVSDHAGISRKEFLPALLTDRLSNSVHVELLGSLLQLRQPRVLEIRSRVGSISAALQRMFGATTCAMALFESQQLLITEVYGIPAALGIDYDRFTIPFEGTFDLIVANHMFTHAIRPREMLQTLRDRLTDDGSVYLFNEPDEGEFLAQGKSVFNTLNAFHMQAFDAPSLQRALEANGFSVTFMTLYQGAHICLARKAERSDAWERIARRSRDRRMHAYRKAQDVAALHLPVFARGRLREPWDTLLARSMESGLAEVNRKGNVKVRRV